MKPAPLLKYTRNCRYQTLKILTIKRLKTSQCNALNLHFAARSLVPGQVVALTSVSVRTLHYYDETNLLKPSHRTEGSHRLYSNDDLLRLQQIITFKFMGFSLTSIQKLLQEPNFKISESLKIQAEIMSNEALRIIKISKLLNYLVDQFSVTEATNWEVITKIIETLQLSEADRNTWYKKFLTHEELHEFDQLCGHRTEEYWRDYHERWNIMFAEVKDNINSDPESYIGIQLAKKWLSLVEEIHPKQSDLSKKLWEGYKAGVIPQDQLVHDQDIIAYITQAVNKLHKETNE
jgi:DNA-binding transcriptional MerR regulator